MKKSIVLWSVFLLFFSITSVKAKECQRITESSIVNVFLSGSSDVDVTIDGKQYPAGTAYSKIPYCNVNGSGEFMNNGACWSFAVSNILRSFGSDIYSEQFAEYFCNNSTYRAYLTGTNRYGSIMSSSEVQEKFKMKIEKIDDTLTALDRTLSEGKGILASVQKVNGENVFVGGNAGHYIAILLKKDNQYYVANSTDSKEKGWVDKSVIEKDVISKINMGLYAVYPSECVSFSSQASSSSSSSTKPGLDHDPYPENGFSYIETEKTTCRAIFMKNDNSEELNELGEFFQGLFTLIKIATPALIIILTTYDYIQAILHQDDSEIKKTSKRTVKRLIIGILIFLLPFLLDLLFHLFGLYDISTCGIGPG